VSQCRFSSARTNPTPPTLHTHTAPTNPQSTSSRCSTTTTSTCSKSSRKSSSRRRYIDIYFRRIKIFLYSSSHIIFIFLLALVIAIAITMASVIEGRLVVYAALPAVAKRPLSHQSGG
jgi:hypothetical protein